MRPTMKPIHAALTALAFSALTPALADDMNEPWAERGITEHVDQSTLKGRLDRGRWMRCATRARRCSARSSPNSMAPAGRWRRRRSSRPSASAPPKQLPAHRRLDANGCSSCHRDPVMGGAGEVTMNVFVNEGFTNVDFDSTDPQFSNERNTNHLMGAGLVELLAREMTADLRADPQGTLHAARADRRAGDGHARNQGRPSGRSPRSPTASSTCENRGCRHRPRHPPVQSKGRDDVAAAIRRQRDEPAPRHAGRRTLRRALDRRSRFRRGRPCRRTDRRRHLRAVAWQATLPAADSHDVPDDERWARPPPGAARLFDTIGCNECHVRALPLKSLDFADPGPFDAAGTLRDTEIDGAVYDLSQTGMGGKDLETNEKGEYLSRCSAT
jgi:hypothetical protein